MAKKILALIIFFYFLILLQTSFLIHFDIFNVIPKFILISVILINFFEKPQKNSGIFSAFIGGFFLDIFSENYIGFNALILAGLAIFIKFLLRKYLRIPFINKT